MISAYWLFEWIAASKFKSEVDIDHALDDDNLIFGLRAAAKAQLGRSQDPLPTSESSVLAGAALDLSGDLDCWALEWRVKQTERLLSRIWLYFDYVVVADKLTPWLSRDDFELSEHGRSHLKSDLKLLWHLLNSGAAPFLIYRIKPEVCPIHMSAQIQTLGLELLAKRADTLTETIAARARIEIEPCNCGRPNCFGYTLNDALFEHTVWGSFRVDPSHKANQRWMSSSDAVRRYLGHLVADITASRNYGSGLGSTIRAHHLLLQGNHTDRNSIAFNLELPVLQGADFSQLFLLRNEQADSFKRFRFSLRQAIDDRITQSKGDDDAAIAREIVADRIQPSLHSIKEKIKGSESLLVKRSATAFYLSSLATTCGILLHNDLSLTLSAGATAVAAATGVVAMDYLKEKRDIGLDDFYFLWQARSYLEAPKPNG